MKEKKLSLTVCRCRVKRAAAKSLLSCSKKKGYKQWNVIPFSKNSHKHILWIFMCLFFLSFFYVEIFSEKKATINRCKCVSWLSFSTNDAKESQWVHNQLGNPIIELRNPAMMHDCARKWVKSPFCLTPSTTRHDKVINIIIQYSPNWNWTVMHAAVNLFRIIGCLKFAYGFSKCCKASFYGLSIFSESSKEKTWCVAKWRGRIISFAHLTLQLCNLTSIRVKNVLNSCHDAQLAA